MDRGGSRHPCPPLDSPKRWPSDYTCHIHLQSQWACYKKWKVQWKAQTGMCLIWHLPPKTSVDVMPRKCRKERRWPSTQTGWKYHREWFVSRQIWNVEDLETLYVRTKRRTSHHRSPEEERRRKKNVRRSSLQGRERAIVNQTNNGIVSKATLGETSEPRGAAHLYGLFRARRYHP